MVADVPIHFELEVGHHKLQKNIDGQHICDRLFFRCLISRGASQPPCQLIPLEFHRSLGGCIQETNSLLLSPKATEAYVILCSPGNLLPFLSPHFHACVYCR